MSLLTSAMTVSDTDVQLQPVYHLLLNHTKCDWEIIDYLLFQMSSRPVMCSSTTWRHKHSVDKQANNLR